MGQNDPDELALRLDEARRADVDPLSLCSAEERFMSILTRRQVALDLAHACETGMIEELRGAIQKASSVGVASGDLSDDLGRCLLQKAER